MAHGWRRSILGRGILAVLFAGATVWTVGMGLTRLDLRGNSVEVRFVECHSEGGGRSGGHPVCSGPQLDTKGTTVKVAYPGHVGETIRAARAPWGTYAAVDTGFVSWAVAVLLPVLPLGATAGAGMCTVTEIRRARRAAAPGTAT